MNEYLVTLEAKVPGSFFQSSETVRHLVAAEAKSAKEAIGIIKERNSSIIDEIEGYGAIVRVIDVKKI